MDIENAKKTLKDLKITYEDFAKMSNVPINTLKNIFSGRTENPRYSTELAIIETLEELTKNKTIITKDYISTEAETVARMFQDLTPRNQEVILRNFYILLNPEKRAKYDLLKNIK